MTGFRQLTWAAAAALLAGPLGVMALPAQQPGEAAIIQGVDAAAKARIDSIAAYTATEHYAVYRNSDENHPLAEMTVKTEYRKDSGKTYTPIAQSGSSIVQNTVLSSILDNEKRLNLPGNREGAWVTSANYEMKVKPEGNGVVDGRNCLALTLTPRRNSPYLFSGTIWVDAGDFSIVRLEGTAAKSPSFLSGPAQVARQYAEVSGFAMAIHARAVSSSFLFGQVIVKIDYRDYHVQLRPAS